MPCLWANYFGMTQDNKTTGHMEQHTKFKAISLFHSFMKSLSTSVPTLNIVGMYL